MIHVVQWACTIALFKGAGKLLKKGQIVILYGPFKFGNKHISKCNHFFDNSLKRKMLFGVLENSRKLLMKLKKMVFYKKKLLVCQQIIFQLFNEKFFNEI